MRWWRDPSPRVRLGVQLALGALAVAAIVVLLRFPNDPAGWAVVALVVVVGDTFGQSSGAAWSRIQGSIVGCLSGAAASLLLPWLWLPLRVVAGMMAAYLLCLVLRVRAGLKLGVALAGFFVFVPGVEELPTVAWRLGATVLGILIALVVELVLWPRHSGDALDTALSSSLAAIGSGTRDAIDRWVGGEPAVPAPVVDAARMRALLAESRREPRRRPLRAEQYDEAIAGIDTAALGLRRLIDTAVPGSMVVQVGDELRAAGCRIEEACLALAELRGAQIDDVERALYEAVEQMRSRHVTPSASAEELVHLFAGINSVALVAEGLRRVGSAIEASSAST